MWEVGCRISDKGGALTGEGVTIQGGGFSCEIAERLRGDIEPCSEKYHGQSVASAVDVVKLVSLMSDSVNLNVSID